MKNKTDRSVCIIRQNGPGVKFASLPFDGNANTPYTPVLQR